MADSIEIRDVWDYNLEEVFMNIRNFVVDYNVVAMDTEFPGTVFELSNAFKDHKDNTYRQLKENVDVLKLIQLGLTFLDKNGDLPTCKNGDLPTCDKNETKCIWQFNFREFNENKDKFAKDSIMLLKKSGINFAKNIKMGIDVQRFGELLMSSGVVLNDEICWVTFHGGSDFGYLLKLLTQKELPESREKFFDLIKIFFPTVYDVKHLMRKTQNPFGGLKKLSEKLEVTRFGIAHQAGSDSLLTYHCFKKIKEMLFITESIENYAGVVYGLND